VGTSQRTTFHGSGGKKITGFFVSFFVVFKDQGASRGTWCRGIRGRVLTERKPKGKTNLKIAHEGGKWEVTWGKGKAMGMGKESNLMAGRKNGFALGLTMEVCNSKY